MITCQECNRSFKHLTQTHLKTHGLTNESYKAKYGNDSLHHSARIEYPRICDCGYTANNPTMWHYHQRTHQPIPADQQCEFGCGQQAQFVKTSGKYSCSEVTQHCPGYTKSHSKRIKSQWDENDWDDRKAFVSSLMKNPEFAAKQVEAAKKTKLEKILSLEWSDDRRSYYTAVTQLTYRTYQEHAAIINPDNLELGRTSYHLDHRVSKFIGWLLGIPPEILAHPDNLEVISYSENTSKGKKCSVDPLALSESHGHTLSDESKEIWDQLKDDLLLRRVNSSEQQ